MYAETKKLVLCKKYSINSYPKFGIMPLSKDKIEKIITGKIQTSEKYLRAIILSDIKSYLLKLSAIIISIIIALGGYLHYRIDNLDNSLTKNIINLLKERSNKQFETTIQTNPKIISRIHLASQDFSEKYDLYAFTRLKEFKNAGYGDWSSDSQRMVFISFKNLQKEIEDGGLIFIYNISDNSLTRLKNAGNYNLHPNFSPDGKTIVFSKHQKAIYKEEKDRWDIAIISSDNKDLKILTGEEEEYGEFDINYYPKFSPDGNHIIFCGKDTEIEPQMFYLFLMDKDGNNRRKICELGGVCDASFSPNGDFIVFQTIISNKFHDIWIAPIVDGKCITDECPKLDDIKEKIQGLVKEKEYGYYYKKLTNIDTNQGKANGYIDPEWLNNEEIMFLFTNEYEQVADPEPLSVNWTVKKINIYTGDITDYPLLKENKYRNPTIINKFSAQR